MALSRRDFLKKAGEAAAGIAIGASALELAGCATTGSLSFGFKSIKESLEETLKPENYAKLTQKWDPVYGPPLCREWRYGGLSDFKGHGGDTPGVDYDVPIGTPLVPAAPCRYNYQGVDKARALSMQTNLLSVQYDTSYVHLDQILLPDNFLCKREQVRSGAHFRLVAQNEIVALSGNSGRDWSGGMLYPHLHLNLRLYKSGVLLGHLDAEKYGLDGYKPVLWDGETTINFFSAVVDRISFDTRLGMLDTRLAGLEKELADWPQDLSELSGSILENHKLMGSAKANDAVNSKHFQDNRALLKKVTLEQKRYLPGSKPYSLMLAFVAHSMVPPYSSQPVIIPLPFIAPGVVEKYNKNPVYEKGDFYSRKGDEYVPVKIEK